MSRLLTLNVPPLAYPTKTWRFAVSPTLLTHRVTVCNPTGTADDALADVFRFQVSCPADPKKEEFSW